jgi:hypothetical protein
MALDVHNPWEAHAYFALGFSCEKCGTHFEFQSPHEDCSDEWCAAIARAAFEAGWFIPHPLPDGRMDFMTAYCPRCGQESNFTQPRYETTHAVSYDGSSVKG